MRLVLDLLELYHHMIASFTMYGSFYEEGKLERAAHYFCGAYFPPSVPTDEILAQLLAPPTIYYTKQ
jgi:hypothetical protein